MKSKRISVVAEENCIGKGKIADGFCNGSPSQRAAGSPKGKS